LAAPFTSSAAEPRGASFAVAGFDYSDTSGEPGDRAAEHAARTELFRAELRGRLVAVPGGRAVDLPCTSAGECTAATTSADVLLARARDAKADFVVFGGIQKMSTLIGWGRVDVLDVNSGKLVFDRVISFRGDSDEAFQRAAKFAAKDILESVIAMPAARVPEPGQGIH
jgi:hypothetical protein